VVARELKIRTTLVMYIDVTIPTELATEQ